MSDRPAGAGDARAILLAGLLLLAGVLAGLSAVFGAAVTTDASVPGSVVLAAFVPVLPGVLALALSARSAQWGLAATAGAGAFWMARLVADLAVIVETDTMVRPELYYETTDRARPFAAGPGAWVLVLADVAIVVVGIVAAGRLAGVLGPGWGQPDAPLFSGPGAGSGDEPVDSAADRGQVPAAEGSASSAMNLPMIGLGFLGAVLVTFGMLEIPYSGGFLDLRPLPGMPLIAVVGAGLAAIIVALVVVVAAVLPPGIGRALLGGTAVAAAVGPLTAIAVVVLGAPVTLGGAVWIGLAGAAMVAACALLNRSVEADEAPDDEGLPPPRRMTSAAGVTALVAAGLAFGAYWAPLLLVDGQRPTGAAAGVLAPSILPWLVAAVPLAIAGVLALLPATVRIGMAATPILLASVLFALAQALSVHSRVLASADSPLALELPAELRPEWTDGWGLWLAILSVVLAVIAAVISLLALRRLAQSSLRVADDLSLSESRLIRVWYAAGVTILTLVALALPRYGYLGRNRSATLILGYDIDTWGIWAIALAVVAAVWAGVAARRADIAAALPVSAAAVAVQPLLLSDAVRAEPGFALSAGYWAVIAVVVTLLVAAPVFAAAARRIRTSDIRSWNHPDRSVGYRDEVATPAVDRRSAGSPSNEPRSR